MAKIIVITSGKGGVGKTTTAVNLGAAINYFGGHRLKYEHLDDDSDDPTIQLAKQNDNLSRSVFEQYNSTKVQKFLKSKKRLIGNTKNGYPGDNLYLDNPKYFFDNINTIYNDIIDYYKVEHK